MSTVRHAGHSPNQRQRVAAAPNDGIGCAWRAADGAGGVGGAQAVDKVGPRRPGAGAVANADELGQGVKLLIGQNGASGSWSRCWRLYSAICCGVHGTGPPGGGKGQIGGRGGVMILFNWFAAPWGRVGLGGDGFCGAVFCNQGVVRNLPCIGCFWLPIAGDDFLFLLALQEGKQRAVFASAAAQCRIGVHELRHTECEVLAAKAAARTSALACWAACNCVL